MVAKKGGEGLNNTPLMEAASRASLPEMQLLVGLGADVNARNALGMTPLACLSQTRVRVSQDNIQKCV